MTNYSNGFFRKCASYGVPYDTAVAMYKAATGNSMITYSPPPMTPPSAMSPVKPAVNPLRKPPRPPSPEVIAIRRAIDKYTRGTGGNTVPAGGGAKYRPLPAWASRPVSGGAPDKTGVNTAKAIRM